MNYERDPGYRVQLEGKGGEGQAFVLDCRFSYYPRMICVKLFKEQLF